jgi:ribosomal protein S18 acetylase RimI-like enzyme
VIEKFSINRDISDFDHLIGESIEEGNTHLVKLINEFQSGTNRFDKTGEALFIALYQSEIVGVGGVHQDPYSMKESIGRVRRVYVLQSYRRQGIARNLMKHIMELAQNHYEVLILRTTNPDADQLYRSLGFTVGSYTEQSSHFLLLKE